MIKSHNIWQNFPKALVSKYVVHTLMKVFSHHQRGILSEYLARNMSSVNMCLVSCNGERFCQTKWYFFDKKHLSSDTYSRNYIFHQRGMLSEYLARNMSSVNMCLVSCNGERFCQTKMVLL